ncbi:hypothetical protein RUM44_012519 [Polyplax serrata]|uniref:WD repeat-containing protein 63 n=1 Tax=Polyplax serrata TaxID=468196 RepID=A0ABR1BBW4_POLSC
MEQVETEVSKFDNDEDLDESEDDKKKKGKKGGKKDKKKKEEIPEETEPNVPKPKPLEVEPSLKIPGLKNVKLTSLTQKIMGCIVGEQVTPEAPWTTISKVVVDENLYLHHESSDFLPLKDDLLEYTNSTILVGYDPNFMPHGNDDAHRFYVAVTEKAKNEVLTMLEEEKRVVEEKLKNSVNKKVLPWESLGSEVEVDDTIIFNSRPLINLELETDIDELLKPVRFRDRNVDDAKDGYVRIGPGRQEFEGIPKIKVDAATQAVPSVVPNTAQTDPGLPSNAWTQYLYDMNSAEEALALCEVKELKSGHVFPEIEYLEKSLIYNENFDLYVNDYPLLVQKSTDKEIPHKSVFDEFEAYTDVSHCKNRLISSIAWHPMWSGIVALSYSVAVRCATASDIDITGDEVMRDVFSKNSVLLWSFVDALKPKLILESPREVHCLAWSPVNPNILVGGCSSGQIIIWDLKGKLEAVESQEYLTPDQQRYRLVIQSLVGWLQPQPPAQYVRPAALSNIQFSHGGKVTQIQWVSPYYEWNQNGHYVKSSLVTILFLFLIFSPRHRRSNTQFEILLQVDEGKLSMQIVSSGEDGVLMVWDLSKVPEDLSASGKPKKKKVRKRPSALTAQISPFKAYDRKFRPIYILYPELPTGRVSTKITALSLQTHPVHYQLEVIEMNDTNTSKSKYNLPEGVGVKGNTSTKTLLLESSFPDFESTIEKELFEKKDLSTGDESEDKSSSHADSVEVVPSDSTYTRKTYKPVLTWPKDPPKQLVEITNDEGDVISLLWEGFDFHKGEQITTEQGGICSWGEAVHDGPVVTCARSPFMEDLFLTVGGRVIALWKQELKHQPLFWKYCTVGVACGSWSPHRPCVFHIGRGDGSVEVWDLARSSDTPAFVQSISGKVLTTMCEHPLPLDNEKSILGIADYNNSFRLLYFPNELQIPLPDELKTLEDIVNREVYVRQTYSAWNESFIKANAEELARVQAKEEEAERIRKEAELAMEMEAQARAKQEEEEAKRLTKSHQGNSLSDRFLERLKVEREKQMQRVLMEKKRLNKNELIAKQQPILHMKQMEKDKRRKQRDKIRQQQKIFDKTVAMLFPEVIEKQEEGPSRIDEFESELKDSAATLMSQYDEMLPVHLKYIKENPFNKRLKWEKVFEEGMQRRHVLDFPLYLRQKRRERYLNTAVEGRYFGMSGDDRKDYGTQDDDLDDEDGEEDEEEEEEGGTWPERTQFLRKYPFDGVRDVHGDVLLCFRLALKAGYSWQTEGGTYLPGGAVAVAHQFLRCILHQLAPNGVFYQMFQTHVEDSARTEFFRSVAQALIDFSELSPSVPLQLLLETLNAKKTLAPDTVVVICKNMSAYMENLPLEVGPVQPGSPWLTLLAQMELFFRRLVLLLPSMDDVLAPLAVVTSVFKCPGISSCKSILDPFSKILSYVIQNAVVEASTIFEVCQLCTRAFTRDREKQMLTRMLIIELVQALKFKTTLPDSNFMMLINFVIQDTGNCLVQSGFSTCTPDTFTTGVNAAEIMRQHLSDALDFLADFHTVNKIKSFSQGDSGGLNEDTLGGALKSGVAQYVALEMARGTRDNRAVARHLPWLYNTPSSLQQGPREFLECMGHVRLLSWLLLGGLFQSLSSHAPCTPIPPEASCHVADHVQVIFTGFAGQSKASVLHMSSLFHAFILCQLWSIYLETGANSSPPGSEPHTAHNTILLDFWGKVTPCVLQLVAHSKVLAEMVNLHFLSLLEALLEVNASILGKLMPLWSPVLYAHHVQLPGHLQVRLQNCRNFAPTNPTSNVLLAKWLQRLQFKMGQIELQSSAATQFYSV